MDNDLIQKQAEANARELAKQLGINSSGGGSRAGGGGTGIDLSQKWDSVVRGSVESMSKLAAGTYGVSDAASLVSTALGKIPLAGNTLSLVFGALSQGTLNANNSLNELGKGGITFGNNLGLMSETVTGARITFTDFQDMMRRNTTALSALGGSADRGAFNFLKLSKEIQETDIVSNLVNSGVSTKELNDLTLITMTNRRTLDVQDASQRAAAIESTSKLAQEMDLISRLTGKSREQQQRDLEAGLAKAEIQATLNQLDDQARMNYMDMRTAVGPLGKNISDLADEIITGGVRTAEGSAKMAALGPAGAAFEAALNQTMTARTGPEKEAAAAALARAKADIASYQSSAEFAQQVKYDTTVVGNAAREQYTQNVDAAAKMGRLNEALKIMADAQQNGITITKEEALAKAESNLKEKEKLAQAGKFDSKEAEEGAKVARAINAANAVLKDQTAGLGTAFKELNSKAGEYLNTQDKAIQYLNGVLSRQTQGQAATGQRQVVNQMLGTITPNNAINPASAAPGFNAGEMPTRSTGSLGTVGKFIEDFGAGTMAMLHGREGVVTEEQLKGLVSQTFSMGQSSINPKSLVSSMIEQLTGGIKTAEGAAQASSQQIVQAPVAQPQVIIPPAMNDLADGINQLNMRMERLIVAVEDGADKTARASKGRGNLIA